MKIIQYADVQVKNREKKIYSQTLSTLKSIENIVKTEKAEIVIISGDLFEYAIPTDQERKLIYNHISRLLNIQTLKEIVILLGNHDLIKEKKQTEETIGENPINVFVSMLNNLDKEKASKIIYCNESVVYHSKLSNKFQYIAYSLEDNMDFKEKFSIDGNGELSDNKLNICLFHAMLREYAEHYKIPLRKDVISSLKSLDFFPKDSLILAGDIHMNLRFEGLNGQLFIYPGSTQQHTHNEGSYYTISDKIIVDKIAERKIVKMLEFDESIEKLTIEDIKFTDIFIDQYVNYETIVLDTKVDIDTIRENLFHYKDNWIIPNTDIKLFIKVKSAPSFVKNEMDFFDIITKVIADINLNSEIKISITVEFDYDKIIQNISDSQIDNKVVKEIISENLESISSDTEFDLNEHNISIDDLALSNTQITKLFESVLDSSLKSISDTEITNDELKSDIVSLFSKELDLALNKSSKRYTIELLDIETNGFMKLLANKIQLNIPGIVRILGTNGIGKTTLYNMVKWNIDGEVFQGMSKNKVVGNNLIVFNKKLIDTDIVYVTLRFKINNMIIISKRTVKRNWKNNVNDEQKLSINWKEYIASLDREYCLDIFDADTNEKIKSVSGEQAEKAILLWFGQTISNILFINQPNLESLLLNDSDTLNNMVLNFVGIDYIKKIEDNLDSVKTELNNISKPVKSSQDLQNAIIDNKIFVDKNIKLFDDLIGLESDIRNSIKEEEQTKNDYNNQLLNIGNIENIIKESKAKLEILNTELVEFEEQTKKEKIVFNLTQPIIDQTLIDNIKASITNIESIIKFEESRKKDIESNNESLLLDLSKLAEESKTNIDNTINKVKKDNTKIILLNDTLVEFDIKTIVDNEKKLALLIIDELSTNIDLHIKTGNETYQKITDYFQTFLSKFDDKKFEKEQLKITLENKNIENNKQIITNLETIKTGKCDKCGTILVEDYENHKIALINQNEQLLKEIDSNIVQIKNISELIEQINIFIKKYRNAYDLSVAKNYDKLLLIEETKNNDCEKYLETIANVFKNIFDLEENKKYLFEIITILESYETIKSNDYSIIDKLSKFETTKTIINKLLIIIEKHKANQSQIEFNLKDIDLLEKSKLDWDLIKYVEYGNFDILNKISESKLTSIINSYKENNLEITNIETKNNNLKETIVNHNHTINNIINNYNIGLNEYQIKLNENIALNNEIDEHNKKVDSHNNSKLIKQSEFDKLKLYILDLEKDKLPIYLNTSQLYNKAKEKFDESNEKLNEILIEIGNTKTLIQKNENDLELSKTKYKEYLQYQKNNLIWKIYSKIVKDKLKEIIFEYYRIFLNKSLNDLLVDVNFKLFWNQKNELYHISYDGGCTYQPVQQSSGMEKTFLGLALLYTIHQLNIKNTISHIFIDEISGPLNNGDSLSYNALNYQEMLVLIINKFKEKTVFIVDHHIKNLYETVTYEVVPDNKGSKYIIKN